MQIGVPRQDAPGERRVALTPEVVRKLAASSHEVLIESTAGLSAGYTDAAYTDAGATITGPEEAWAAEFVATVLPPPPGARLRPDGSLLGMLSPFDDPIRMAELAKTGVTAFAFEAVPRTTRAQSVDALSSQATVAGYQAVLEAASMSDRFFPMLTTAAGTIAPSKVLILGAGVAGLQAIATARRLGAVVSAFDVRAAAAEQVQSLGATFVAVDIEAQDAATSGGYAQEVAADEQARILAGLAPHIVKSDVVIATAAIPGKKAPLLITGETVESMRAGSVIIDLAASTGGNCELTQPGQTIRHGEVTIVGDTDLVSRTPGHASQMYAKNVVNFLDLVTGEGGALAHNWDDDIVAGACVTRNGAVAHPRLKEALS